MNAYPSSLNESFSGLAADLAMTIADCLEHPDCPANLVDSLNDASGTLIDILLPPSISAHLRAAAALAQSGDSKTRPEAESFAVAAVGPHLIGSEPGVEVSLKR